MSHDVVGQGHGVPGRFGGLPDAFSSLVESKIVLVPVPFDQTTTYQQGADLGPAALIEASRNLELYDIETDSQVYLQGIATLPPVVATHSTEMRDHLYQTVKEQIASNKFVVTLGGEHSISYAPILAHAEAYPGMSVLQIDAHADLQPAYEGNPWSHASVMARVREISSLSSVVAVAIRSMSLEEKPSLKGQTTIFGHEIDLGDSWMDRAIAQLHGPVYITFDLDAFDSSLLSSTGTPEPGGLQWNQTMRFLQRVAREKKIIGFDVVELCPIPGHVAADYLAAKLIYKLLSYIYI